MDFKWVKYEVEDGILTLTINQPEKMNAQNADTMIEMERAFDVADNDDLVRVVIVTGAGASENYFMERMQGREDNQPHRDEGGVLTLRIYDMKKPVIAAINGAAVGIGITMTLPMDIRIASKNARMGFVFARRGIVFDGCASWFLPRAVGISTAAEWVYSGKIFPAQEAYDKKLISEIVEPEDLMPRARQIAAEIVQNTSSISVALCRQLMWKMLGADHPMEAHIIESKSLNWIFGMPDAREGIESFIGKRPPAFPMKLSSDMPVFYPWWKQREFKYY
ncbi:MAG: enoyl-CoA hydratase-related protein [Chloroflexi bacterium]|nr:enoyl-CoA hydratase-related protein [Chloroflexota bacterium]